MKSSDEGASAIAEHRPLLWLLGLVSLALVWILLPFFSTLLWSTIIALLFAALHRRLLLRLRRQRTLAALLTILIAAVIVVVPLALLSVMLVDEAVGLLALLQSFESRATPWLRGVFEALPGWAVALLRRLGLADIEALQRQLNAGLQQASGFMAGKALTLGQGALEFAASLRLALPLTPAHQQELLHKFSHVIRSTVRGNLVVAALQGALGGLAFWFLGVRGALLWAAVMAFLSLLPAIGAALVWLPVALWFLATGAIWQGVALAAWGVLVIGLVDNLLRPMLVGKATLMPDYVVMITTLGGMVVFGINGFVLGPVIAAMFFAVWHMVLIARQAEAPVEGPD
jgi:predicted PurR-regulated permease PerM